MKSTEININNLIGVMADWMQIKRELVNFRMDQMKTGLKHRKREGWKIQKECGRYNGYSGKP